MHASARAWFEARAAALPRSQLVVEIGGRDINGGVRDLFPADHYVSCDLHPGPGVDIVADATAWTPGAPVDLVLCAEVLEHAPEAAQIIANAHSWLAPGGILLLATVGDPWPPHSGYDGGPVRYGEFYRGVSVSDLHDWLAPFAEMAVEGHDNGDRFALGIKDSPGLDTTRLDRLWLIEVPA